MKNNIMIQFGSRGSKLSPIKARKRAKREGRRP